MNPSDYQQLAARTECDQWASRDRMAAYRPYDVHDEFSPCKLLPIRVNHALMGMTGEIGELAGAIENWLYYNKGPLDVTNIKEELGDLLWYIAEMCNALGLDLNEVMCANIRKLQKRYPDRYSDTLAAEENRNREAEREALNNNEALPVLGNSQFDEE